jgi:hypothetical protein
MNTISLKSYGNPGRAGASFSFTSHKITLRACFTELVRAVFTAECTVSFATINQTISQTIPHMIKGWNSSIIIIFV